MKYVKKPIPVEAVQITSPNMPLNKVKWLAEAVKNEDLSLDRDCWCVWTMEGYMYGSYGSYLIKGPYGELYPCHKEVFEETYEPID